MGIGRRWGRSSRLYAAMSLLLALLAGLLVHAQATRLARATDAVGGAVGVVVAAAPVARGEAIRAERLRLAPIPRAFVPPGAFSRIADVAGRVALAGLSPGEPVTETRLARVRAGPVASLVPQGLRAFAVPTSLPAGTLAPGDRVDVLATYGTDRPRTETVVSGVEVLAVSGPGGTGSTLGPQVSLDAVAAGVGGTATLLLAVTPSQQEGLAFARAFANLEVTVAPG